MKKVLITLITSLILLSCSSSQKLSQPPTWYVSPQQNNSQNLYGVAQGYTLEEATKYALADAAARLTVTVSGQSSMILEENKISVNEEMRQQIQQNIEKINFTNFQVSRSTNVKNTIYVEVEIERSPFIRQQEERIDFLEKKITNLDKGSLNQNPINRRNSLINILDLAKELELKGRILQGAGKNFPLQSTLNKIADYQNQLNSLTNKVEFYFEINSPKEISNIIRKQLNKENIKISRNRDNANKDQIVIRIRSNIRSNEIYGSYITKLEVDFENIARNKVLASNSIEVSGSSAIGNKESYKSALKSLEEKITKEGILKILGISS